MAMIFYFFIYMGSDFFNFYLFLKLFLSDNSVQNQMKLVIVAHINRSKIEIQFLKIKIYIYTLHI